MQIDKSFREFTFGELAAETEADKNPELLRTGFVDVNGEVAELLNGYRFLVLGGKGTGKSAIAKHIKLASCERPGTFVHIARLKDCTYSDLKDMVRGEQNRLPSAWSWLLLATLFASFKKHAGDAISGDAELSWFDNLFELSRLAPSPDDLDGLVQRSRRKPLTQVLEAFHVERNAVRTDDSLPSSHAQAFSSKMDFQLSLFVDDLRHALLRLKTNTHHFLIIDDTDEVLRIAKDKNPLFSLSALIQESAEINQVFRDAGVSAKIIILCRTELFERLPGPNTNKLRQGYALELNWYRPDYLDSPLWQLANKRARLQCDYDGDILEAYLPPYLVSTALEKRKFRVLPAEPAPTKKYLLRHTRLTPRDFVMLLNHIASSVNGTAATVDEVGHGLQEYANVYFKTEIDNELYGYVQDNELLSITTAFRRLRNEAFMYDDLRALIPQRLHDRLPEILDHLFDSNILGNWDQEDGTDRRVYRYKFPHCSLDPSRLLVLHPALAIAFNVAPVDGQEKTAPTSTSSSQPTTPKGVITHIDTLGGFGFVRTADGWLFHFSIHELVGHPHTRVGLGSVVTFDPPDSDILRNFVKGQLPCPHVHRVQLVRAAANTK
jgi:hypothetical protein